MARGKPFVGQRRIAGIAGALAIALPAELGQARQ